MPPIIVDNDFIKAIKDKQTELRDDKVARYIRIMTCLITMPDSYKFKILANF